MSKFLPISFYLTKLYLTESFAIASSVKKAKSAQNILTEYSVHPTVYVYHFRQCCGPATQLRILKDKLKVKGVRKKTKIHN